MPYIDAPNWAYRSSFSDAAVQFGYYVTRTFMLQSSTSEHNSDRHLRRLNVRHSLRSFSCVLPRQSQWIVPGCRSATTWTGQLSLKSIQLSSSICPSKDTNLNAASPSYSLLCHRKLKVTLLQIYIQRIPSSIKLIHLLFSSCISTP